MKSRCNTNGPFFDSPASLVIAVRHWREGCSAMAWRTHGDPCVMVWVSVLNVVGSNETEDLQLVLTYISRVVKVINHSTLRTRKGFRVAQQRSSGIKNISANRQRTEHA